MSLPKPLRILIVDDSSLAQTMLKRLLTNDGHEVLTADNGLEGIKTLIREAVDCIIMDISMPVMDGITATRTIRGSETSEVDSRTPIIALTAYDSESERQACLDAGMNFCLGKPIKPNDLRTAIQGVMLGRPVVVEQSQDHDAVFLDEQNIMEDFGLEIIDLRTLYRTLDLELEPDNQALDDLIRTGDAGQAAVKAHAIAGSSLQFLSPLAQRKARELEQVLLDNGNVQAAHAAYQDACAQVLAEARRRLCKAD